MAIESAVLTGRFQYSEKTAHRFIKRYIYFTFYFVEHADTHEQIQTQNILFISMSMCQFDSFFRKKLIHSVLNRFHPNFQFLPFHMDPHCCQRTSNGRLCLLPTERIHNSEHFRTSTIQCQTRLRLLVVVQEACSFAMLWRQNAEK
jgi:hypothetical protein